ncbi:MFS transporter [Nakamurella sp. PAMC28650]|uniref:MFS transporter n=1 Tax=Nakamurella sp. PAMC28650 TaxID=2762325 RepID=UPI00164D6D78|nr:MFS transporter [Nakamurella sp. PAMC28650]QNK81579.1 MFS transporter [Nakamurella sp. PAMC28650]
MSVQTPVRLTRVVLGTVVLVSAIALLATDMYVPAFPRVGADLAATATQVQLTLTTFFVGMALGQLIGGPVSDSRGRRVPLLAALFVMTAASFACAFSPTITLMMAARFVQGLAGGWAMVTARAVVVDLSQGPQLVRSLNLVAGVGGIAPIVGPLLGAVILQLSHWQVSFWVVAALGALMIVAVATGIPESLPPARRHRGGLAQLRRAAGQVVGHRAFVGYLVVMAFSMGVTFAYVATSAFILQSTNGLSPIMYSVDFAANAVGLALATLLAARLAGRVLVGPNAGALASAQVPEHPGTGSAVLGFLQWCMAGLVAPIAGLGGEHTAVPMALIILVLAAGSLAAVRALTRPTTSEARSS